MTLDYSQLGFKAGIEVHQRLDTRKLFCDCYSDPNTQTLSSDVEIHRKLFAVSSELGELDPTARFEAAKRKQFRYLLDARSSCAVEADEEPPHAINSSALDAALQVARMLGMRVVDEVHVMRKQVIDGSSVSGFQRTACIALNGQISTSKGSVRIPLLCLEEESAGIMEITPSETVFRLDRQGIPLLEITTDPSLQDPTHVREAAESIGKLLRATGKVQRGLGTIRQDLNISIANGARVEIKGAQDLKLLPLLVENEVLRQTRLIEVRDELQSRRVSLSTRDFVPVDITSLLSHTPSPLVQRVLQERGKAFALKLKGFAGYFKKDLMPQHTFGREIASHVKQGSRAKGIIHSDEDLESKYGFSESEIQAIRTELDASPSDLFVICLGTPAVGRKALEMVFLRCKQALSGVVNETRKAQGSLSLFMRPLPGAARMYPETDVPPIPISSQRLASSHAERTESLDEKKARYLKWGLNEELASKMVRSSQFIAFEKLLDTRAEPSFIAVTLLETSRALKREGYACDALSEADWRELFTLFSKNEVVRAAVPELLKHKCGAGSDSFTALLKKHRLHKFSPTQLEAALKTIPANVPEKRRFGEFMRRFRLNVDAAEAKKRLPS
ncbi:Glu-tRNA(Gln) amidotransferase subunit GatE [Candidatus Micrarchaeota archaeon]|nr:Glu-tRNA(Gln) amidotransferase subunit GatE [Candidatus Micrarchaeota archaeon]